jgi:hypothetical protein
LKKVLGPAAVLAFVALAVVAGLKFLPKKQGQAAPVPTEETRAQIAKTETESPSPPDPTKPKPEEKTVQAEKPEASAPVKKEEPKAIPMPRPPLPAEPDLSSANIALARVTAARSMVVREGIQESELFRQLADEQTRQGQRFLAQKSPLEARSLFIVSERLYRLCLEKKSDEDRLLVLKKSVETLRSDLENKRAFADEDALYRAAKDNEKQGVRSLAEKDILNASQSYIKAFATYQKFLLSLPASKDK